MTHDQQLPAAAERSLPAQQLQERGFGNFGMEKPSLVERSKLALARRGSHGRVLVVFNGGRASAKGVEREHRHGLFPNMVLTTRSWHIYDMNFRNLQAQGELRDLLLAEEVKESVRVHLTRGRYLSFYTGSIAATPIVEAFNNALSLAHLGAGSFPIVAPLQEPVVYAAHHFGGYGTPIPPDTPAQIAFSSGGVCVLSHAEPFLRPLAQLQGLQSGGMGEMRSDAGWVGGGFGVAGALKGALFASVMNWVSTATHMDSVLRLRFDDAEATFALLTTGPGRVGIELSALLATLRGSDQPVAPDALGLASLAERAVSRTTEPHNRSSLKFCGGCGTRRADAHAFCTECGFKF
ncbi:hypothetical protein FOJ82_15875 [Tessaracoccus rhinocerotis]|uniref:Uncharacterized protein n=1 Tax=Tessaracoccus rhinocerotis TaxID=1689449 RepID=A0A553JVQ5_9ACTN|nr:hypothetical protein [Tessaracoccus rhinocerotis]TRY16541.1 hypothetical protein FOJ82_15875 [Tessaracoccus rhinocerotis]